MQRALSLYYDWGYSPQTNIVTHSLTMANTSTDTLFLHFPASHIKHQRERPASLVSAGGCGGCLPPALFNWANMHRWVAGGVEWGLMSHRVEGR